MVVVTLGHRLTSESIHPHLRRRVDEGIAAFRDLTAPALVFTGGATSPGIQADECDVMATYAVEQGVDPGRIHLENRALDTIGNGYFSRLVVDRLVADGEVDDAVETISVVTADYHARRAAYVFEQCFGDEYEIDSSFTVETPIAADQQPHEVRRLEAARRFFEPIEPGDVDAIGRRLRDEHDYYEAPPLQHIE